MDRTPGIYWRIKDIPENPYWKKEYFIL